MSKLYNTAKKFLFGGPKVSKTISSVKPGGDLTGRRKAFESVIGTTDKAIKKMNPDIATKKFKTEIRGHNLPTAKKISSMYDKKDEILKSNKKEYKQSKQRFLGSAAGASGVLAYGVSDAAKKKKKKEAAIKRDKFKVKKGN